MGYILKQHEAIKVLTDFARSGRVVFTLSDLATLFPDDSKRALREAIVRLLNTSILTRVCNGVFVNTLAQPPNDLLEAIAKTIRRGEFNYVSLESALSEYGVISQIPIDRLTVMTTGRSAEYRTAYGVIEFIHTKRTITDILASTVAVGRPLRLARREAAYRDLKRVGRNLHLVDEDELHEN